jgi:hypothetical protein
MKFKSLILAIVFVFASLYSIPSGNCEPAPEKITQTQICQEMANGFQIYLEARALDAIRHTKNAPNQIISLVPKVHLMDCISATKVRVKVVTKIKLRNKIINPKTKLVTSAEVLCGVSTNVSILERKGAFIRMTDQEQPIPTSFIPCK